MPLAHLTLLVPELLWPEPGERDVLAGLDCPALTTLMARGRPTRRPAQAPEAMLAEQFGHVDAPYAAIRRLGERGREANDDEACWIAADPVHLRFHQERLILADGATLHIAAEEANRLAEDMNRHFSDIGRTCVGAPERWYLALTEESVLRRFSAPPLSSVCGRSIERLLPEIMQERVVRGLVNEIQTFLHAHPVNQQREARGLLPLNSLWFWGAGRLPARRETEFDGVWSTAPLAAGLARAAGVPAHPLPADAATLLRHAAPATRHLVLLEDLLDPARYENGEAYRHAIAGLEERWFAPLRAALAVGHLTHLCLAATTAYGALTWESRRQDQWRFWRRGQPLAEIARTLAKDTP